MALRLRQPRPGACMCCLLGTLQPVFRRRNLRSSRPADEILPYEHHHPRHLHFLILSHLPRHSPVVCIPLCDIRDSCRLVQIPPLAVEGRQGLQRHTCQEYHRTNHLGHLHHHRLPHAGCAQCRHLGCCCRPLHWYGFCLEEPARELLLWHFVDERTCARRRLYRM